MSGLYCSLQASHGIWNKVLSIGGKAWQNVAPATFQSGLRHSGCSPTVRPRKFPLDTYLLPLSLLPVSAQLPTPKALPRPPCQTGSLPPPQHRLPCHCFFPSLHPRHVVVCLLPSVPLGMLTVFGAQRVSVTSAEEEPALQALLPPALICNLCSVKQSQQRLTQAASSLSDGSLPFPSSPRSSLG